MPFRPCRCGLPIQRTSGYQSPGYFVGVSRLYIHITGKNTEIIHVEYLTHLVLAGLAIPVRL